ncbi:hypothetical protein SE_1420 [Staphylococcus epidermidis ATCC 12228]|uniref:Uncharacterized protein n=1 Tax=Staphylococcus epidermidis (strain ATCC 12228 / FDA PCI 1200) TaxID=176280 RepID=A0A0H2VH39_STAES|nr:hypothetical protein SE_1420 [Staphylococcus epidermidis ATCC 12228]
MREKINIKKAVEKNNIVIFLKLTDFITNSPLT